MVTREDRAEQDTVWALQEDAEPVAEGTGKQGLTLVIPKQGGRNGCHGTHPDVSLCRLQLCGPSHGQWPGELSQQRSEMNCGVQGGKDAFQAEQPAESKAQR